jgi:hypothetical protein
LAAAELVGVGKRASKDFAAESNGMLITSFGNSWRTNFPPTVCVVAGLKIFETPVKIPCRIGIAG